jgi:hypothetical protein
MTPPNIKHVHPRKLNTKKCSTMEPRAKSANALAENEDPCKSRKGCKYLSGETSLNSDLFSGLTCARRDAVRTNWPTELANL